MLNRRQFLTTLLVASTLVGSAEALAQAAAAQQMVDLGFTARSDYARQTLLEVPYNEWREYNPEDTIRFYALRLREAGMIESSPAKIIADGTDWRLFNELKG